MPWAIALAFLRPSLPLQHSFVHRDINHNKPQPRPAREIAQNMPPEIAPSMPQRMYKRMSQGLSKHMNKRLTTARDDGHVDDDDKSRNSIRLRRTRRRVRSKHTPAHARTHTHTRTCAHVRSVDRSLPTRTWLDVGGTW